MLRRYRSTKSRSVSGRRSVRPFAIIRRMKRSRSDSMGSSRAARSSFIFSASETTSFADTIRERSGTSPMTRTSFSAWAQTASPRPVSWTYLVRASA